MAGDEERAVAEPGRAASKMEEGDRAPAIGDDLVEAGARRKPVVRAGDVDAGGRPGRDQEMHHPLVEQEPQAAMDGDEDRRLRPGIRRREEVDAVARVGP